MPLITRRTDANTQRGKATSSWSTSPCSPNSGARTGACCPEDGGEPLIIGAEEGTRTPTPLRVHGPEPCASANSATSAFEDGSPEASRRGVQHSFYRRLRYCQTAAAWARA